jgi:hypothetical protein
MFEEAWVRAALTAANASAVKGDNKGVTRALRRLPVELFIHLYVDELHADFTALRDWLPSLPSDEDQRAWAGNSGLYLLRQAAAFVEKMMDTYAAGRKVDWDKISIADYGCGWGRLMRLLYRYVPADNVTGLDPWDVSLELCRKTRVHGQLALIDYVPKGLPTSGPFDIIFAYSVFTHISAPAQSAVLTAMRNVIARDGLLALTIRPGAYWTSVDYPDEATRQRLLTEHVRDGFAFHRHSDDGSERASVYGDTSMSIEYIHANWKDWQIVEVDWRHIDELQLCVFLRPV